MENERRDPLDDLLNAEKNGIGSGNAPISKIVQIFRDADPRVRARAARLVGRYTAYKTFLNNRLQETDSRVRANVIESLWHVRNPAAEEALQRASADHHHRVRSNALVGLYFLGSNTVIHILESQAKSESAAFRTAAAWAMGETRDPRFVEHLTALQSDPVELVRGNAEKALSKIKAAQTAEQAKASKATEAA